MARKGENIYKRRDGRWEGRYKVGRKPDGKMQYRSVYAKSYREVKEILIRRKAMGYINPPKCIFLVKDLMDAWLNLHAIKIKESSYFRYEGIIRCHILPFFDGVRVNDLTPEMLTSFIKTLQKSGRADGLEGGLSENSVESIYQVLRSAIKLANKRYGVNLDSLLEIKAPSPRQPHIEILGEKECETIAACVLSHPDVKGIAFLLALCYGLRIGEVCGLKWADISYEDKTLTVNRTAMRLPTGSHTLLTVQAPKTENANRTIPMTADMVELLSGFQKDLPNDVFILTGRKDKPFEPRSLQSSFHAFLKKHGLPDHTFHSLRHTFATRVIEKGYDPKTVSEILGHKNVKTTLDLYVHPSMTHKREIVEAASLFPEK